MESRKIIRLTSPASTTPLSPTSAPSTSSRQIYWRCPFPHYVEPSTEVKRETKEIKTTPTAKLIKCVPTNEITPYLAEDTCNNNCNLISQLPPELLYQIGLMEPKAITSILPLVSKTIRTTPEIKSILSILREHQFAREEIKKLLFVPTMENKDLEMKAIESKLIDLRQKIINKELGEEKETLPLIIRGLISFLQRDNRLIDSPSFDDVLNRVVGLAIKNRLLNALAYLYLGIGRVYFESDNFEKSIENINKSLSFKETTLAYNIRGLNYYRLGNLEKAIENFNKAIEDYESGRSKETSDLIPYAYYVRGEIYFKENRPDNALRDLNRFLLFTDTDPVTLASAHNLIGSIYADRKEYTRAISEYTTSLSYKEKPNVYFNRASAYEDVGNNINALADLQKSISLLPTKAESYTFQGSILTKLNRLDEAKESFDKALELGENSSNFFRDRAQFWEKVWKERGTLSAIENAIKDYRRALSLNPSNSYVESALKRLTALMPTT